MKKLVRLVAIMLALGSTVAFSACFDCTTGNCGSGSGATITWRCSPSGTQGSYSCCSTSDPCYYSFSANCTYYYYSCTWAVASECGGGWGQSTAYCYECF